jgi:hypothetical protein
MVTWLLYSPKTPGPIPPLINMPDDATTGAVFPGVQARAVVSLILPLVEYTVHSTGISISYLIGPSLGWLSCTAFLFSSPAL